jgi:hypothetical protein
MDRTDGIKDNWPVVPIEGIKAQMRFCKEASLLLHWHVAHKQKEIRFFFDGCLEL